jgi:ABC-type polar amino acid transport system ATPase subunit
MSVQRYSLLCKMLVPLSVTSTSNVLRPFTLDSHRRNLTFITFMINCTSVYLCRTDMICLVYIIKYHRSGTIIKKTKQTSEAILQILSSLRTVIGVIFNKFTTCPISTVSENLLECRCLLLSIYIYI